MEWPHKKYKYDEVKVRASKSPCKVSPTYDDGSSGNAIEIGNEVCYVRFNTSHSPDPEALLIMHRYNHFDDLLSLAEECANILPMSPDLNIRIKATIAKAKEINI